MRSLMGEGCHLFFFGVTILWKTLYCLSSDLSINEVASRSPGYGERIVLFCELRSNYQVVETCMILAACYCVSGQSA